MARTFGKQTMEIDDFDDPAVEERWCNEQRDIVLEYLKGEGVQHGRVGDWPAWHLPPYVAIWAIESLVKPERIGWWVISGDLSTDYISASSIKHPRDAMRAFAEIWGEVSEYLLRGEPHPTIEIGTPSDWPLLGDLLKRRSRLLAQFSKDDSAWVE